MADTLPYLAHKNPATFDKKVYEQMAKGCDFSKTDSSKSFVMFCGMHLTKYG